MQISIEKSLVHKGNTKLDDSLQERNFNLDLLKHISLYLCDRDSAKQSFTISQHLARVGKASPHSDHIMTISQPLVMDTRFNKNTIVTI